MIWRFFFRLTQQTQQLPQNERYLQPLQPPHSAGSVTGTPQRQNYFLQYPTTNTPMRQSSSKKVIGNVSSVDFTKKIWISKIREIDFTEKIDTWLSFYLKFVKLISQKSVTSRIHTFFWNSAHCATQWSSLQIYFCKKLKNIFWNAIEFVVDLEFKVLKCSTNEMENF